MSKISRPEKESDSKKPTRYFSKKQEDTVSNAIGGCRTANSGAGKWQKGDVTTPSGKSSFLIECKTKTTHSESISIKKEWFEKNQHEALFMGKQHCALVFNFGPDEENHYVIDEYLFKELVEYLENKETV